MSDNHDQFEDHGHHVISNRVLNTTFIMLLILMVLTIAFARLPFEGVKYFPGFESMIHQYQGLWILTNAIALGIATIKLVLVITNFMGVKFQTKLVKLYAICGFVGFSLLFIMFFDYYGREWEPVKGWEKVPSTALPRQRDNEAGMPLKEYPGTEEGKE